MMYLPPCLLEGLQSVVSASCSLPQLWPNSAMVDGSEITPEWGGGERSLHSGVVLARERSQAMLNG